MVNLKALEAAINQVEKIREHELTFDAGGTRVSLRALRPQEETEIQRYAQVAFEGGKDETDQATFGDFMDRLRHASLGFSVVQIGDLDLRGVEYVETGDEDENGNPISMPKWEAIRDLISREWSRPMLTHVFAKFGELLDRVDLFATERVKLDPVDAKEEIERLERRLEELRTVQANAKTEAQKDGIQQRQTAVRDLDRTVAEQREHLRERPARPVPETPPENVAAEASPAPPERAPATQAPPAPPQRPVASQAPPQPPESPQDPQDGRRSALPDAAPAAPDRRAPQGMETARAAEPPAEVDPRTIKYTEDGDSFFDPADPDEALAAETKRQILMRRHQQERARARQEEAQAREQLGIPTSAELAKQRMAAQRAGQRPQGAVSVDPRTAGLRDAANASDATFDTHSGRVRPGRPQPQRPQAAGDGKPAKLHGKPVYKMPTQTLDRPARQQAPQGPTRETALEINPGGPAGSRNENFRGPGEQ